MPAWLTNTRTSACASGRRSRRSGGAGGPDGELGRRDRPAVAGGAARGSAEGVDHGMTEKLFLDEPRAALGDRHGAGSGPEGIVLDRTVFYARSGGQPGDVGVLRWDGGETAIADTVKGEGETILHVPAPGATPAAGRRDGRRRDRLGSPLPADAHAHRDAPAVQPDPGRRGDRRVGRRGSLAAGFRPAESAAQGGDRGRAERADRGGPSGADRVGGSRRCWTPTRAWCARCR